MSEQNIELADVIHERAKNVKCKDFIKLNNSSLRKRRYEQVKND